MCRNSSDLEQRSSSPLPVDSLAPARSASRPSLLRIGSVVPTPSALPAFAERKSFSRLPGGSNPFAGSQPAQVSKGGEGNSARARVIYGRSS